MLQQVARSKYHRCVVRSVDGIGRIADDGRRLFAGQRHVDDGVGAACGSVVHFECQVAHAVAELCGRCAVDNHVDVERIARAHIFGRCHATADPHVVECGNLRVGELADFVIDVDLSGHEHVALVEVGVDVPVGFFAHDGEVDLHHAAYAEAVGQVDIFGVAAYGYVCADGERHRSHVAVDGAHGFVYGNPRWQSADFVALRRAGGVVDDFRPIDNVVPGLRDVGVEQGEFSPFHGGKVGVECPRHGFRVVAVLVLDIVDGSNKVVVVHQRQGAVGEGEVDFVGGGGEVELRVVEPHLRRAGLQRRSIHALFSRSFHLQP